MTSALKKESEVIYLKLIQLCNFHLRKKEKEKEQKGGPNSLPKNSRVGRIQLEKAIGGGKIFGGRTKKRIK